VCTTFCHRATRQLTPVSLHDALPIFEGSTLSGFIDDVEVVSAIDATYGDAGLVGVYSHGDGAAPSETTRAHLGDFSAQTLEAGRSEEHTSELQSREKLVCRLPREEKK